MTSLHWAAAASELGRVLWFRRELTVSAQRPLPARLRSSTACCHAAALDPGSRLSREPPGTALLPSGIFQGLGVPPAETRLLHEYERQPSALKPRPWGRSGFAGPFFCPFSTSRAQNTHKGLSSPL